MSNKRSVNEKKGIRRWQSLLRRGLGRFILLWFLAVSLIPLAIVSLLTYMSAHRSLQACIRQSLAAVTEIKTEYIHSYFNHMLTDLREKSESTATVSFLEALRETYGISWKSPRDFVLSYEWEVLVRENAGGMLTTFLEIHGYRDLLLIDADGNVLFSVMREDDLGANLFMGKYADMLLASACRRSLDTGQSVFSDFEFYAPFYGAVAGFLVSPVVDAYGENIGLLVLQIPIDRIDRIMQVGAGLGKTGESYLIGVDLAMRSNSIHGDKQTILGDPLDTQQSRAWLREHGGIGRPLVSEKEVPFCYQGYRGARVIGTHRALEIAGIRMGVIAEIEEHEAFAPIVQQRNMAILVGLIALIALVLSAMLMTRSIVNPVHALHEGTEIIGNGNLDHRVGTDARNEIGELSRSFDTMVGRLKRVMASRDELNREVAQRKQTEKDLQKSLIHLERSNQDLEQFAFSASHDLQEPLRKILAFGSLLEREYGNTFEGDGKLYMATMRDATLRMQTLISDLLSYSRVATQGKAFAQVDMNETVRGVLSDLETRIHETNANVDVADLPSIEADPIQMRQLMQNLIGNALKFQKDHQPPHVEVYAEPVAAIEGAEGTFCEQCRIVVKDNGIGFDEKYTDRIFGVFQRLHRRTEYSGSGIGLAICRRIAERHDGTITAKSKPGEGAMFRVTLPLTHVINESGGASS